MFGYSRLLETAEDGARLRYEVKEEILFFL